MAGQPSFGAMGQQPRAPAPGMAPGYGMQPQQGQQPFTPGNRSVPFGQPIAEPAWSQGQQRVQGGLPPAQGGGLAQAYAGAPPTPYVQGTEAPGGYVPSVAARGTGSMAMMGALQGGSQFTGLPQTGGMVDTYDATGRVTGQQYRPSNLVNEGQWRAENSNLFPGRGQVAAVFNTPEMQALRDAAARGDTATLATLAQRYYPGV